MSRKLFRRAGCIAGGMTKPPWDLRERTIVFAVAVYRFCRTLQDHTEARNVVRQLQRAASSAAANYRASKRGRSDAEFISKIGQAIEEADECLFWLDFLSRIGLCAKSTTHDLTTEADQLVAILTASQKTAKARRKQRLAARRTQRLSVGV
jgi:four helix bundle protein